MNADGEHAAAIRRGDEATYAQVFAELYPPLCSYANRMLAAPDITEELVQDVFVKLWRNRATLFVQSSLKAYLYRAVRNAALNHIERRRTEQRWYREAVAEAEERARTNQPSGATYIEAAEVAAELDRAIERLPARCRQVVELRWRHGLKHAEIADALGISVKGVENHLARGLQALRSDLSSRLSRP